MSHAALYSDHFFFRMTTPPPPPTHTHTHTDTSSNSNKQHLDVNVFNIRYYPCTSCYYADYEDNIYNPHATWGCFLTNTNQKKEKSISDVLVMVRPERVTLGLSSASSSSELMNARI